MAFIFNFIPEVQRSALLQGFFKNTVSIKNDINGDFWHNFYTQNTEVP